nr:immunoglobulin heavy chain junction region [Mus musculus]
CASGRQLRLRWFAYW